MERPTPQLGTQGETLLRRIAAFIVDAIIVGIGIGFLVGLLVAISDTLGGIGGLLGSVLFFAYFIYMEGTYGQTIGKKLLGIMVVMDDGAECDIRAAAIRNVLRLIDGLFVYLVGIIAILVTDDDQRVGDIVGDTLVVKVQK